MFPVPNLTKVDMGEPIVVKEVEIAKGETLEDLTERIHTVEWKAIVEGTNLAIEKLKSS